MKSLALSILLSLFVLPTTASINEKDSIENYWQQYELSQLVVTGTRTPKSLMDVPILTKVITADDIKKSDATNIQDLLQQEMPGIEFSYAMNQQTHLNFSGFGGQSILFLVDGERLAGETMDDIDFSRLNMNNVERIEIVKGAVSALYGSNASGGVINIITKTPAERWTLNVNSRLSRHNDWRYGASFGLNNKHLQNHASYVGTSIDSYDVTNGPDPQSINLASTFYGDKTHNVNDKLIWNPSDDIRLTMRAGYYFREKKKSTYETNDRFRDWSAGIRGVWNITPNSNLDLSYAYDQYDKSEYQMLSSLDIRSYSNVQNSLRGIYNHTLGSNILTVGMDYIYDYLLNTKTTDGTHRQQTFDLFAQYDWNISKRLELVTALRYDYLSENSNSRLTPKLNLHYKPLDGLNLRAGYGMGFRAPTLKERYYIFNMSGIWDVVGSNVIGTDLKPELSHNFNISADYIYLHHNLTATAYYNIIRDRICTGSPLPASVFPGDPSNLGTDRWLPYTNIDRYKTYGFDITSQAHYSNGWGYKLSYAYVHEDFVKDTDGEAINNQYTPARPHTVMMRIDWDHRFSKHYALYVGLSGRYLSPVDNTEYYDYVTLDPSTGKLLRKDVHYNAYTIWKIQTSHRIGNAVKLTLAVDNIFNYNPTYHYYNAPFTDGANLQLGVSIDIDKF